MSLQSVPATLVSGLEQSVESAVLTAPASGTGTIFTVVGAVQVLEIFGVVTTTAGDGTATNLKISAKVGTKTAVDICTNGLVTSLAVGAMVAPKTSFGTALVVASPLTNGVQDITSAVATAFIVSNSGIITVTTDATNAIQLKWYCRYRPISAGSYMLGAQS